MFVRALAAVFADPLAGRPIARSIRVITWGVAWACWWWSVVQVAIGSNPYPPAYFPAAMTALALPLLLGIPSLRGTDGPVRALQTFVAVGLVLLVADLALPQPLVNDVNYWPLNNPLVMSLIVAGAVLPSATATAVALVGSALVGVRRSAAVGVPQSLGEWAVFAATGLASVMIVTSIRGELDRLAEATREALAAQESAARVTRGSDVRRRLDGLIHDTLLGALTLAARGQAAGAAGLAEDALAQLAPGASGTASSPREGDSVALILDHARALRLQVVVWASSWPGGPAGETLRGATCEALTNCPATVMTGRDPASTSSANAGHSWLHKTVDSGYPEKRTTTRGNAARFSRASSPATRSPPGFQGASLPGTVKLALGGALQN